MCALLAMTYEGGDPTLWERVFPLLDCVEVTPDALAEVRNGRATLHGPDLLELQNIQAQRKIVVHGVGLSIGSHDGCSSAYLALLDELLDRVQPAWHSEHLAYTLVDGQDLGAMLALPRSDQVLDLLCERVLALQARYGLPFLLENVIHLLPSTEDRYSEAEFLNTLAARTGCGLLLDLYNLECDAHNHGFDVEGFLAELELDRVRELHLACGAEHRGFLTDVHSRRTRASTRALAYQVLRRAPHVEVVTYELLRAALPALGLDALAEELAQLRHELLA